ncbi:MAG: hypothetical protein J0647_03690 [Campylobacteraceae bacterium]|nr:hypothetical protein [Campylobacteraceae bacterium]
MLILLPFIIIILIVVAIDYIYYSDVKPSNNPTKEISKKVDDQNTSKQYLDKYIKK